MEAKDIKLLILVIAKHKSLAKEIMNELTGTHQLGDTKITIYATASSALSADESLVSSAINNYFTAICFYANEQSDLELINPMIESYSSHPIKVLVHDPDLMVTTIPLPKVSVAVPKAIVEVFKDESKKLYEQLYAVFNGFDKDSSGYIDADELILTAKELGYELEKEGADLIISKMDRNGDNKISFEEFKYWWSSGRTLFGLNATEIIERKLKDSVFAKASEKVAGISKESNKITNSIRFGYNKDMKAKSQILAKIFTIGPEYNELKKAYFPKYIPKTLQGAIIINCKDPVMAKMQMQKIVDAMESLIVMMSPEDIQKQEPKIELVPKNTSLVIRFPFIRAKNDHEATDKLLKESIPILRANGQKLEVKLQFANDLEQLCTEDKSILNHLFDGFSLDVTSNLLEKNVEYLVTLFDEMEMPPITALLLASSINIDIKTDATVAGRIVGKLFKEFLDNHPMLMSKFPELKSKRSEEIKEEINTSIPLLGDIYNFAKDQVNSIELLAINDYSIISLFAVLPGLHALLSLN